MAEITSTSDVTYSAVHPLEEGMSILNPAHFASAVEAIGDSLLQDSDYIDNLVKHMVDKFTRDGQNRLKFKQAVLKVIRMPEVIGGISRQIISNPSIISIPSPISVWDSVKNIFSNIKFLLLAIAAFGLVMAIPIGNSLSVQGHRAMGIFVAVIILWVTEAIPLPVTSLLACVLFALLRVVPGSEAFVGFGNHTIFFLMGALLLGTAIVKVNLHTRIALLILTKLAKSPARLVLVVMVTGAGISLLMPEHGVGAMLFPILIAVMVAGKEHSRSNFAKAVILAVAYGTNIGSMGSLLGGAKNPLAISLYQQYTGNSVSLIDWMETALPLVVVMLFFTYLVLKFKYPITGVNLKATREYMAGEVKKLGRISPKEKQVIGIFILTFFSWAVFGEAIGLAVVAIAAAVILLMGKLITWEDVERKMSWDIIFLYGGAITMGKILGSTGVAEFISKKLLISTGIGNSTYLLIAAITILSMVLTQLMSNSAATSVILPIALPVMSSAGIPPIVAMYCVAMSSALAFMLPIATPCNAMAYSTKYISVRDLLRTGIWLNLIGFIVFMTIGIGYWKLIGLF